MEGKDRNAMDCLMAYIRVNQVFEEVCKCVKVFNRMADKFGVPKMDPSKEKVEKALSALDPDEAFDLFLDLQRE